MSYHLIPVFIVLGSLSKMMATIATQPLIVAKVGLQSKPPPARNGKPFKTFGEVMQYIVQHEGLIGLFKGIGPQIMKGLLVQGFLMMAKERQVSITLNPLISLIEYLELNWFSFSYSDTSAKSAPKSYKSWPTLLPRKPARAVLSSRSRSRNLYISCRF